MDIQLEWQPHVKLHDGHKQDLIYTCNEELLPEAPGIYVFARKFGSSVSPLYIGKANNLRARIKDQFNNMRLMKGVEKAQNGIRIIMLATLRTKRGQQFKKVLKIVEPAYIDHAISQGHELLNKQGTKTPVHTIKSDGRKDTHLPFPRRMNMKTR